MDKINKLTNDEIFMSELEAREWAEWEEKSKMSYARNTGLSEGQAEGKEETTKELILLMIENKLSFDTISKIINKTIEEIKEIVK